MYQRAPRLEVSFRYKKVFLASDPPPPHPHPVQVVVTTKPWPAWGTPAEHKLHEEGRQPPQAQANEHHRDVDKDGADLADLVWGPWGGPHLPQLVDGEHVEQEGQGPADDEGQLILQEYFAMTRLHAREPAVCPIVLEESEA